MSVRAEMVRAGLRWLIKHRNHRELTVEQHRRFVTVAERLVPDPPPHTRTLPVDADGVRADFIATPASEGDRHVLFLHGGAFIIGSPNLYRHLTWRIASAARARLLAVDYRLAPEHPFPAALEDAFTAYNWLVSRGTDPGRIAVMGDSAGGGLVFSLMLRLRDEGYPLPGAAVALSPWTDLALTGASLRVNAIYDPMLSADDPPLFVNDYLAGADPRAPYVSPSTAIPRACRRPSSRSAATRYCATMRCAWPIACAPRGVRSSSKYGRACRMYGMSSCRSSRKPAARSSASGHSCGKRRAMTAPPPSPGPPRLSDRRAEGGEARQPHSS